MDIEFIFNILDNAQIGDTGKAELKIVGQCGHVLARKKISFIVEPNVKAFHLYDPYPNPTNSSVNIRCFLAEPVHLKIEVFNILGKKITILTDKDCSSGIWELMWDGRDKLGQVVASGLYMIQFKMEKNGSNQYLMKRVIIKK